MVVAVVVSLVESISPPPVQVVVSGVGAGSSYVISGATVGGLSWPVPGGVGVGDGGQIALVDSRAPLNAPAVYRVVVDGVLTESAPVTVPGDRYVLQSLDGQDVVAFVWLDDGLPREPVVRSAAFMVPGRARPVVRYDTGGDGGGEVTIRTTAAMSRRLEAMLREGGPLVVRTDGAVRDLPAADIIMVTRASSRLWGGDGGVSTQRIWSLEYVLVDDPAPDVALGAATWDDFDAAGLTWDEMDALGLTWDEWDTYDWRQLA